MAEPCLEAGDEARPQPEEEMQAPMVAVESGRGSKRVMNKSSRVGASHCRQDLTTASLDPAGALPLLQVPALSF